MQRKHLLLALGEAVAENRKILGISQETLAEKAGLHRTYIGAIERGLRNPTIIALFKIAKGLEVSPEHLVHNAYLKLLR